MRVHGRRIVITGLGAVTPLGHGWQESWERLLKGESGIAPLTLFDPAGCPFTFAGEVKNWDSDKRIDHRKARRLDRFSQFALCAALEAVADAGLELAREDTTRIGVVVGNGLCGLPEIEEQKVRLQEKGPRQVSPFLIPKMMGNAASAHVSIELGLRGPNYCVVTACAAGSHSIGEAARHIRYGEADVMCAGATEAVITALAMSGFHNMGALSTWTGSPQTASRPFDRERTGFVIAEGAAVLVLEELERAQRRGARIYGELMGYGLSADASHITMPDEGGEGAVRAMGMAIRNAGLQPDQIGYINAHGTSTILNDKMETKAIKRVLGEHARRIPVSSTKSMTGHMLAAAGAFEAVVTVLTVSQGLVHPTANYTTPDPDCDLDYVVEGARRVPVRYALSNSLGFGGHNAALVFGRYEGA